MIECVLNQWNDGITEGELCAISEEAVTYIVYSSLTERQISDRIVKQLSDELCGNVALLPFHTWF